MKKLMRSGLLLLALVIAASSFAVRPAEAAPPPTTTPTTITYQGYTLSWSKPDASDLRVVRTAGRPDRFPAQASDRSVSRAKSRVASTARREASSTRQQAAGDSCTGVPDAFGRADFQPACAVHDECYGSATSRRQCDLALLGNLTAACTRAYSATSGLRLSCYTVASIYYVGVRVLGRVFYDGTGDPS